MPTYADEVKEQLVVQSKKHFEQISRARTAWRVIREHLDANAKDVIELDQALEIE